MLTSRAWIVTPAQGSEMLDAVASTLTTPVERLPADRRLPIRLGGDHRRLGRAFVATPQPLIDSWRVARLVEHHSEPGDAVVIPASGGLAGVMVLEQPMHPEASRRTVIVVADGGVVLRAVQLTGRIDGLDGDADLASAADWELVAYRHADEVLTTSPRARDVLAGLGVLARLVATPPEHDADGAGPSRHTSVWGPEAVSREAQTPAILRAVAAARTAGADLTAAVATADAEDRFWAGTTWDAVSGVRAVLGAALSRTDEVPHDAVLVLGDPYAEPPPAAARARAAGHAVIVAEGSPAAARWPDAAVWSDERELGALLTGSTPRTAGTQRVSSSQPVRPAADATRARRISAAIPVFRDVRFLDEAVTSLLRQTQAVEELLLVDDGSADRAVDEALAGWEHRDARIRVLRPPNRGVCAARNLALEAMSGDAFVLLDQDDVLEPTFVEACAAVLRAESAHWAVATWTEFFGAYDGVEAKPPFDARVGRRENPIVSTCALVDMRVRDLGIRFADDLAWIYCEDWDFWAQIVAAGGTFGLVPQALARHRVHPSSGGHRRTPLALAAGRARATAHLLPLAASGPQRSRARPLPGDHQEQDERDALTSEHRDGDTT